VNLPLERPLFRPPHVPRIDATGIQQGDEDIPADALFDQVYVDKGRLAAQVRRALQTRAQVSLADIIAAHPLEQGLAELVAYLSLAVDDKMAVIDEERPQTLVWADPVHGPRQATMPLVLFTR
jgi:hypothetical protein